MLCNWICLWVLDARVVLGEDRLHFYANFEGGMAMLLVPEVDTLEDGLSNLSLDMIQGKVAVN